MTTDLSIFEPSSDTHTPLGTLHSEAARDHLWMHFTRHSVFEDRSDGGLGHSVPIITRGEGHKIWDDRGNEYIDGLPGLFVSGRELAESDRRLLSLVVPSLMYPRLANDATRFS